MIASCLSSTANAQPAGRVRELTAPEATANVGFGSLLNVEALHDGAVLINDGSQRRLVLLDATLAMKRVVLDSVGGTSESYGPSASPLIRYLGDSVLFIDGVAKAFVVIDPKGKRVRVMAATNAADLP